MSEQDIVREILHALHLLGAVAWRQQSGTVKVRGGYMRSGEPGIPDIGVVCPPHGRYLGLEVKTAKGKLRPEQVEWAKEAEVFGAKVVTVRSVQDAVNAYQAMRG